MRSPAARPDTNQWNQALKHQADALQKKCYDDLARALNRVMDMHRQAECDHTWGDYWDHSFDGHRTDSDQIWYCTKKCGARTRG